MQRRSDGQRAARLLATLATGAFVFFLAAAVALNLLRSDYDPLRRPMSNYATGPYGWLMGVAFVVFGCGVLALVAGLVLEGPSTRWAWGGWFFLTICGLGTIVAGFYPADLPGAPPTRTGQIHILDAIVNFTSVSAAALWMSFVFRLDARWRTLSLPSAFLALGVLAAFAFMMFCPIAIFGLANKLFVVVLLTWFLAVAMRLRRVSGVGR